MGGGCGACLEASCTVSQSRRATSVFFIYLKYVRTLRILLGNVVLC